MRRITSTAVRRTVAVLLTTPLLVVGLATAGNAAAGSASTYRSGTFPRLAIDPIDPDPIDPPPPCPERTDFGKDISLEIETPVTVSKRFNGPTYLVVFTLRSQHAFNPFDPNGCTGTDGVVSKLGTSINTAAGPTLLEDQRTVVKELTPGDPTFLMVYHFKLKYQKDFNTTGVLNPKRDARWCLVIPVMAAGTVQNLPPQRCA